VGQTGKVIAFEPAKKNYDLLIKNINLNGFDRIIVPYNMAVSDVS
jgi:FkbM family methyltransferase